MQVKATRQVHDEDESQLSRKTRVLVRLRLKTLTRDEMDPSLAPPFNQS